MKVGELKEVIKESLGMSKKTEELTEAYVARPKQYDLKTEMLLTKTKEAHLELYENYIKALNDVSAKLDIVSKKDANSNSSDFCALKHSEQRLLNAVYLHELYFANINDPYSEIGLDSLAFMRLARDFGTFEEWQHQFVACAMSTSNGWAVCGINTYLKRYTNIIIDEHTGSVPVGFVPLIALDLFEHARRDYLNNKKEYIISMMKELNWNVIEKRFQKADLILSAIQ